MYSLTHMGNTSLLMSTHRSFNALIMHMFLYLLKCIEDFLLGNQIITKQHTCLKGQFTPKSKIHIFRLTCCAIYQSRLFWCELPDFGDIGRRDFCLFLSIIGVNGALLVVVTVPQNICEKLISNVSFQKS